MDFKLREADFLADETDREEDADILEETAETNETEKTDGAEELS